MQYRCHVCVISFDPKCAQPGQFITLMSSLYQFSFHCIITMHLRSKTRMRNNRLSSRAQLLSAPLTSHHPVSHCRAFFHPSLSISSCFLVSISPPPPPVPALQWFLSSLPHSLLPITYFLYLTPATPSFPLLFPFVLARRC